MAVNSTEIGSRLFPAIAGSLAGLVVYRWLAQVWNRGTGLAALLILTFSPNLVIEVGAQARGYPLEILFAALALFSLDAALETKSVRGMMAFSFWLYLAILTEYSASWFAGAAGIYFLARARDSRVSRRLLLTWAAGQAGALGMYAVLCRTSIRPLSSYLTTGGYLKGAFPQPDTNLLDFAARGTPTSFTRIAWFCWPARSSREVWWLLERRCSLRPAAGARSVGLACRAVRPVLRGRDCVSASVRELASHGDGLFVHRDGAGVASGWLLRWRP